MTIEKYKEIEAHLSKNYGNNFSIESTDRWGSSTVVKFKRWYKSTIGRMGLVTEYRIALFVDEAEGMFCTNEVIC